MGVPFIENVGQADAAVAYYAETGSGSLFVTRDGELVYTVPAAQGLHDGVAAADTTGWSVTERLVGGHSFPLSGSQAPTYVDILIGGDPLHWRRRVPTYSDVALGEVWPGITVRVAADGKRMEKIFVLAPGASPASIRIHVDAPGRMALTSDGALAIRSAAREVHLTRPVAYQAVGGERRRVDVRYVLHRDQYGFRLGAYDPTLPLTIDPLLQATYLGGSGTGDDERASAVAVNRATGDVYVVGRTTSADFPCTKAPCVHCGASCTNGAQPRIGPTMPRPANCTPHCSDAFVARFTGGPSGRADLTTLAQVTYLGGSGDDSAAAIAINPTNGDVYVAGMTNEINPGSKDDFPTTSGAAQSSFGGASSDAFVALFDSTLTVLRRATYLGGDNGFGGLGNEGASGIAFDSGSVYVAGTTSSGNFPCAKKPCGGGKCGTGCTDGAQNGLTPDSTGDVSAALDGFVARLSADLSTIEQSTYLGGASRDGAAGIAVTAANVYVAGSTRSDRFPCTGGVSASSCGAAVARCGPGCTSGAQTVPAGDDDAFVARLGRQLTTLDQATYLGAAAHDEGRALAAASNGVVYVAGFTDSAGLPCTGGAAGSGCTAPAAHCGSGCTSAAQSAFAGNRDAFVARLNGQLTTIDQATYLGGSALDEAQSLAVGSDVYVAGRTISSPFPCTTAPCTGAACGPSCTDGALKSRGGGTNEGFVARLDGALTHVHQATFLGGGDDDFTNAVGVNAFGDVYVAGSTLSNDFRGTTGGAQTAYGGGTGDAYVARFSADLGACPPNCPAPNPTCDDGVRNGHETDVDCGGGCCCPPGTPPWACAIGGVDACVQASCKRCHGGQSCRCGSDCDSGVCEFAFLGKYGPVVWRCAPMSAIEQPPLYDPWWKFKGPAVTLVLGNAFYVPAKLGFAALGGLTSAVALAVTFGTSNVAASAWYAATGGDYVITPDMAARTVVPRFIGVRHERTSTQSGG